MWNVPKLLFTTTKMNLSVVIYNYDEVFIIPLVIIPGNVYVEFNAFMKIES